MKEQRKARYDFLDALRGIAILAVMALHFTERVNSSGNEFIRDFLWPVTSHGYLGVQLFFVISGYCITAAMYATSKKDAGLRLFLQRRVRRIYPPYWCSMVLVVVMGAATCVLMRKQWTEVFPLNLSDWGLNVVLLQMPFGAPDASEVYWSLSIEIQFYLLMALCLLKIEWTESFLILITIVSMLLLGFPIYSKVGAISVAGTIFTYWPEFACGIAAYFLITRHHRFKFSPLVPDWTCCRHCGPNVAA